MYSVHQIWPRLNTWERLISLQMTELRITQCCSAALTLKATLEQRLDNSMLHLLWAVFLQTKKALQAR